MADKIVVMDKGTIVAFGTHQELMSSCELYKTMFESQSEGFLELEGRR